MLDEASALAKFGLWPDAAQRARVRETAKEHGAQGRGDTDLMKLCCVQLCVAGEVEDVLQIWAAKSASMDANGAIDVQLLCGAGLERTKAYLRRRGDDAAARALARIVEGEATGDFEGFSRRAWAAHCIDGYTTDPKVSQTTRALVLGSRPKAVGYWYSPYEPEFVHPQALRRPGWVSKADKQRIVEYLRAGVEAAYYLGFSHCRFPDGPPDTQMGCRDLTDGEWIWPEGLAIYVESFDVRLPDEFVETMRRNRFVVPRLDRDRAATLLRAGSFAFWLAWSRAQA